MPPKVIATQECVRLQAASDEQLGESAEVDSNAVDRSEGDRTIIIASLETTHAQATLGFMYQQPAVAKGAPLLPPPVNPVEEVKDLLPHAPWCRYGRPSPCETQSSPKLESQAICNTMTSRSKASFNPQSVFHKSNDRRGERGDLLWHHGRFDLVPTHGRLGCRRAGERAHALCINHGQVWRFTAPEGTQGAGRPQGQAIAIGRSSPT